MGANDLDLECVAGTVRHLLLLLADDQVQGNHHQSSDVTTVV